MLNSIVNVMLGDVQWREHPRTRILLNLPLRLAFRSIILAGMWLMLAAYVPRLWAIEVLHSFSSGTNGMNPRATLLKGADGELYGTSEQGGAYGFGTIFKVNTNGTLTLLHSFDNTNGANPYAGLIIGADGNYYGTTYRGSGNAGAGTIFRCTTNGAFKMLLALSTAGTAAELPAGLVLAQDGNYYGTTWTGRSSGNSYGSIFRFRVLAGGNSGTLTSLYSFGFYGGISGISPNGNLIQGPDNYLYGTTVAGGVGVGEFNDHGTVFRVSTNGAFTSLCSFFKTNGAAPSGALVFGPDGALYGATTGGGTDGIGTVFRVTTNGALSSLMSFNGTNGSRPNGGLVLAGDGNFYGTTKQGGAMGNGTIFRVTTNGFVTTLYSFVGDHGAYSYAGLVLGADGNMYGCTYNGYIFRVTTNGDLTVLATFNNSDGANPYGNLVVGSDGKLYGTTQQGGSHGNGTVFTVSTNGEFSLVSAFAGTNGANPYSGVTFGPNGLLYGTTTFGGNVPKGCGMVYQMDSNGWTTALANFSGTNGESPYAGVTWAPDGRLYGTTRLGGGSDFGVVFGVSTNGVLSRLYSFDNASGSYPYAGLTVGPDARLYGVSWVNQTKCFKITTNGLYTGFSLMLSFNYPFGTLTLGDDGSSFYGTYEQGWGSGGVFRLHTNGTTSLVAGVANGASPRSSLFLASDRNLYGTTYKGGLYGRGTVFQVTTSGVLTSLASFAGPDGGEPTGSVTLAGDGNFYGTTTYGGEFNAGVIYRIRARPYWVASPQGQTNVAGAMVSFAVTSDGVPPLTYQWLKNGSVLADGGNVSGATTNLLTLNNISDAEMGQYSVIVSNAFGTVTSSPAFLQVITPPTIVVTEGGFGPNGFGFSIHGSLGSVLLMQGSSNLVDWVSLATITNQTGVTFFTDPVTNRASQFYRALQQ